MDEDVTEALMQGEQLPQVVQRLGLTYHPEYHLHLEDSGRGEARRIDLAKPPSGDTALVVTGSDQRTRVLWLDPQVECTSWYTCSFHGGWLNAGFNGQSCPTGDGGVLIEHKICT